MNKSLNRRDFIRTSTTAAAAVGLAAGPHSFGRGSGAPNERVVVAIMGGRGRAAALARSFAEVKGLHIGYIFDVDERPIQGLIDQVAEIQGKAPKGGTDFRRALDDGGVDALVIGAPDHWHTPASIVAMQAGKHVYVEKPASHNPREAELIVRAQRRYDRVVQMGNQQRSSPESIRAMKEIREGVIGRVYFAKAWYVATRGPIGHGKVESVPSWLNYELWQGPAPRTPYRDNVIHYNWHWFRNWGTGEVCNNGTHEIDVCRWALGVDYPKRVQSSGGRYQYEDDWEFYDTQVVTCDFPGGRSIVWEGRSCNGLPFHGRGRGASIHGTEGSVVIDRSGYVVYDRDSQEVKRVETGSEVDPLIGRNDLTNHHAFNFLKAVTDGKKLHAPIEDAQKSVMLCHLGNIAQYVGRSLDVDHETGRVLGDPEAMSLWGRTYEPGWEPVV